MTLPPCYEPLDEDEVPGASENSDPVPAAESPAGASRRSFLVGSAVATASAFVVPLLAGVDSKTGAPGTADANATGVTLDINGKLHKLKLDPRTTLLDALRENLDLTGAKKGCDQGACGACTVLVDGRRINSCLTLAVMHGGKRIVTIEGLASEGRLHPLQAAFIRNDGFQCGYCTPGQICSALALISEGHTKSDDEIREWMSGNLCRCGAYVNIVAAVREAANETV
ncbi:MAG TPA: 2Fe-2S iron-sulfur cluster-binding protein [Thermoanaerobaculia bacterium]|nr:2Fe-2S iron-sulfur cluster-binding protein [Thermoanaerobaculia bacterium]